MFTFSFFPFFFNFVDQLWDQRGTQSDGAGYVCHNDQEVVL